jgi:hypothetical protein
LIIYHLATLLYLKLSFSRFWIHHFVSESCIISSLFCNVKIMLYFILTLHYKNLCWDSCESVLFWQYLYKHILLVKMCKNNSLYIFLAIFLTVRTRVARWHIFKPKIPIGVNFGGSCYEICWYILWPFGLFYGQLVNFVTYWYILWLSSIFFQFWYVVPIKIWQHWLEQNPLLELKAALTWLPTFFWIERSGGESRKTKMNSHFWWLYIILFSIHF